MRNGQNLGASPGPLRARPEAGARHPRTTLGAGASRSTAVETSAYTAAAAEQPMRRLAFSLYLLFVLAWFTHLSERLAILGAVRFDLLLLASITGLLTMTSDEGPP